MSQNLLFCTNLRKTNLRKIVTLHFLQLIIAAKLAKRGGTSSLSGRRALACAGPLLEFLRRRRALFRGARLLLFSFFCVCADFQNTCFSGAAHLCCNTRPLFKNCFSGSPAHRGSMRSCILRHFLPQIWDLFERACARV